MLNILTKGVFNFLVEKSLGIKIASFVAVVLCGGVIYKGWQNHQKNEVFKLVNENIEIRPTASGNQWVINWVDNADDETGFIVERRQGDNGEFSVIATIDVDGTSYTDSDISESDTYCYKIGAFNKAGTAYSDESCIDAVVSEISADTNSSDSSYDSDSSTDASGSGGISTEFINKPSSIELAGREFYSFKSDVAYNFDYSDDSISDVNYNINSGTMYYVDSSSLFVLNDDDTELDDGFVSMNYNTSNDMTFTLNSSGEEQVASIYLSLGAWTTEDASISVSAGDNTETILLSKNYTWLYLKVDITFDSTTEVTIKPGGTYGGYSKIKLAGVLLSNETESNSAGVRSADVIVDETSEVGVISLDSIDLADSRKIDVSDVKYVTSEFVSGNDDLSVASVSEINYQGSSTYSERIYTFTIDGDEVAEGYTAIDWDEDSSISIGLDSDEYVSGSLYLKAAAWNSYGGTINVLLNGEDYPIEITSGRKWFYIRVDFSFSGNVTVDLQPVDTIGSYSKIMFAGITLQ